MSNFYKFFSLFILLVIFFAGNASGEGKIKKNISVDRAEICIKDSETEDYICKGNSFSSSAGRIYCITKISGMYEGAVLIHYWVFNGKTMASYPFTSKESKARFMSPKSVSKGLSGNWSVEIRNEDGEPLKIIPFSITP